MPLNRVTELATSLNWADWTLLAIVAVSCVLSLLRGFVKEALSLLSWIAASFVAIAFHERLAAVFSKWITTPSIRTVLAFAALFVMTLLLGAIINWLVHQFIVGAGLSGLDRLLGMAFGAARGLLLGLALLMLLPMALPSVREDGWWVESKLIPYYVACEDWARATFGEVLGWRQNLLQQAEQAKHKAMAPVERLQNLR